MRGIGLNPGFEIKTPRQLHESLLKLSKSITDIDMRHIESVGKKVVEGSKSLKYHRKNCYNDTSKLSVIMKIESVTASYYNHLCKIATIISQYINLLNSGWSDNRPIVSINDMIHFINNSRVDKAGF